MQATRAGSQAHQLAGTPACGRTRTRAGVRYGWAECGTGPHRWTRSTPTASPAAKHTNKHSHKQTNTRCKRSACRRAQDATGCAARRCNGVRCMCATVCAARRKRRHAPGSVSCNPLCNVAACHRVTRCVCSASGATCTVEACNGLQITPAGAVQYAHAADESPRQRTRRRRTAPTLTPSESAGAAEAPHVRVRRV
jgi:hypothetical protein